MIRRALALGLLLLGLCAADASAGIKLPLSHAGRWITDTTGRVTVLHGLNMVYKRPPYAPTRSASATTTPPSSRPRATTRCASG